MGRVSQLGLGFGPARIMGRDSQLGLGLRVETAS